jgi:hypothetical protein
VVDADVDWGTLQVPDRLRPISARGSGGALGPVYVIDPGRVDDPVMTGLELRVADPSLAPATLAGASPVRIEGHFDDPASSECRPDGVVWPETTDEVAAQMCRALFVVTRIEPID